MTFSNQAMEQLRLDGKTQELEAEKVRTAIDERSAVCDIAADNEGALPPAATLGDLSFGCASAGESGCHSSAERVTGGWFH